MQNYKIGFILLTHGIYNGSNNQIRFGKEGETLTMVLIILKWMKIRGLHNIHKVFCNLHIYQNICHLINLIYKKERNNDGIGVICIL